MLIYVQILMVYSADTKHAHSFPVLQHEDKAYINLKTLYVRTFVLLV